MVNQKINGKHYTTPETHNLRKQDLKEGQVYLASITIDWSVKINQCYYAIIQGELRLHRSANWEDIPTTDLRPSAFLPVESQSSLFQYPEELPFFLALNQKVDYAAKVSDDPIGNFE